jgi:hypothetical protein
VLTGTEAAWLRTRVFVPEVQLTTVVFAGIPVPVIKLPAAGAVDGTAFRINDVLLVVGVEEGVIPVKPAAAVVALVVVGRAR